jgi:aspartate aminotransferase-like enzyme
MKKIFLEDFVFKQNKKLNIFTPGPASLILGNIINLRPCFGRGDQDYLTTYKRVEKNLKKLSGQNEIISFQGSGSLACEILCTNFLSGKVLIISTGYYSDRLYKICDNSMKSFKLIKSIDTVNLKIIYKVKKKYDWIWCCYVETSKGLKLPIFKIKKLAKKLNAQLALDATASIGLEKNHELADVISFSSCKGLFGLTGAAFVASKKKPINKVKSFYLNYMNHVKKKMTGPYHIIQSLDSILIKYKFYLKSVLTNKKKFVLKYKSFLKYDKSLQPLICTHITKKLKTKNKKTLLYLPRIQIKGSVVSHLGEVYLGSKSKGKILNNLK